MRHHLKQIITHKPSQLVLFSVVGAIIGILILIIILPKYLTQQIPGSGIRTVCNCFVLAGTVPSVVLSKHAKLLGPHNPNESITLSISLALRNAKSLNNAINTHQTITRIQERQLYDPTHQQVQQVVTWLQSNGFTTPKTYNTFILITTKGTVKQAEQMLHIQINDYQIGNSTFFAPSQDPEIDKSLSGIILSIIGLDNWNHNNTLMHVLLQ